MSLGLNVMDFCEELERIPKPTLYQRQGKECYLDPYREKLIPATPEETVRQKVLIWLENELNVPHDVILVEMLLSKYRLHLRLYYGQQQSYRPQIVWMQLTNKTGS